MYEVFISFKYKVNQRKTDDYAIAKELYEEFTSRGRKVFFSPVSLEELGETDWRKTIDTALSEANVLLLVGTSLDNINAEQVLYEWKTGFLEEIINNRKPFGQLYSCTKDVDISELPPVLRNTCTNFNYEETSVQQICNYIENKLGRKKGTRENSVNTETAKSNAPREYKSRFKYNAGYTHLIGREDEMDFLEAFCKADNSPVSWTAVYGKGGVGKSRLAFEFCRRMEEEGWKVYPPSHAKTMETFFKNELANIQDDTLICFDYAKYELDSIEELIRLACEFPRISGCRVRFLLIERNIEDIEEGFSLRIRDYRYGQGFLELSKLNDESILKIIEDYLSSIGTDKILTDMDRETMLTTLEAADPDMHRPLFALFIADAWVDNSEELKKWDDEAAVKYVVDKELDRIDKTAQDYAASTAIGKQYTKLLRCFMLLATVCGEIGHDQLIQVCEGWFDVDKSTALHLIRNCEFSSADTLYGVEPDLIGEYLCIKIMNALDEDTIGLLFDELYGCHFYDAIAFIDKMSGDYEIQFMSADWSHHCTDMVIPQSIKYIKNNMFRGFSFIRKVQLHEQIGLICKGAFRDCRNLTKINFPHNLEIIESAAFMDCSSLISAMPDDEKGWVPSIIKIEDRAFKNCSKLKRFVLPKSVREVGASAFENCADLESIEIPREIATISYSAFEKCTSLTDVSIRSKADVVIQAAAFSGCSALLRINLEKVSYIGKRAFEKCIGLKRIVIGKTCTGIGESAFSGCGGLEIIDLSETGIERIADKCFKECTQLERVLLPKIVRSLGSKCFFNCPSLSEIHFPKSLTKVDAHAFLKCRQLTADSLGPTIADNLELCAFRVRNVNDEIIQFITSCNEISVADLPRNITAIGERAFYSSESLISINLHEGVRKIGKEAFYNCSNLKRVTGTISGVKAIDERAFCGCISLKSVPGDGRVNHISDETFKNCASLENVRLKSNIETIGRCAFAGCSSLSRVSFKGKCKTISAQAFYNCPKFYLSKKYHIENQSGNYYINGFIFNCFGKREQHFVRNYLQWEEVYIPGSCVGFFENPFLNSRVVKKIIVPGSVKRYIDFNFSSIPSLESIELPPNIYAFKRGFFKNCKALEKIRVGRHNYNVLPERLAVGESCFENCASVSELKIEGKRETIETRLFKGCSNLSSVGMPEGLQRIKFEAFSGCQSLCTIIIPDTVEVIDPAVFKGCSSLTSVPGLGACKIECIENELFDGCSALSEVELPEELTSIRACAFRDCHRLRRLDLFNTQVNYIGIAAFQNCYMLQEIVIPFGVKEIKEHTFKSCTQLVMAKLPPEIETIGTSAFFSCNMLKNIDLRGKNRLETLGNDAFAYCHQIEDAVIPSGVRELPRGLFRGCVSLKRITFEEEIPVISEDCFKDCKQLTTLNTPGDITVIRAGAFRNCFELKDTRLFEHVTTCEPAAFRSCLSLEEINFDSISTIPANLLLGCINLRKVSFPKIEQIGNYAFCECRNLAEIPIDLVSRRIGNGTFWNCLKLKDVHFSNTLNDIGPSAFRNCEAIEEVEFPEGIRIIQATVFRNAASLSRVYIPETAIRILRSAFRDCRQLSDVWIASMELSVKQSAFAGCKNLYYLYFPGKLTVQTSAFDDTPCKAVLQKNEKVEWITEDEIIPPKNE